MVEAILGLFLICVVLAVLYYLWTLIITPIGFTVFICVIIVGIVIGIIVHKKRVEKKRREKLRKLREEQERKAEEAKWAREKAEMEQREKEQWEQIRQRMAKNPIITTAVPAIAVQHARFMVLKQITEPYQKVSFTIRADKQEITIDKQSIPYAKYGLSSISNDRMCSELAKIAAEAFRKTLSNEFSTLNTRCRTHVEHDYKAKYIVTCEIGFADSRSW